MSLETDIFSKDQELFDLPGIGSVDSRMMLELCVTLLTMCLPGPSMIFEAVSMVLDIIDPGGFSNTLDRDQVNDMVNQTLDELKKATDPERLKKMVDITLAQQGLTTTKSAEDLQKLKKNYLTHLQNQYGLITTMAARGPQAACLLKGMDDPQCDPFFAQYYRQYKQLHKEKYVGPAADREEQMKAIFAAVKEALAESNASGDTAGSKIEVPADVKYYIIGIFFVVILLVIFLYFQKNYLGNK